MPTSDKAGTAIFYSINPTPQTGLRGVSLAAHQACGGNLQTEFPRLRTFATLSPIPGFRAWLGRTPNAAQQLDKLRRRAGPARWDDPPQLAHLRQRGGGARPGAGRRSPVRQVLLRCAAHYLGRALHEGKPIDPVARFHLGNGARGAALNWAGDPSLRG